MVTLLKNRKYPRISTHVRTVFSLAAPRHSAESFRATVKDISPRGAYIETHHPLNVGDEISFAFQLPQQRKTWTLPAVVRWRKDGESQGIGVELLRTQRSFQREKFLGEFRDWGLDRDNAGLADVEDSVPPPETDPGTAPV